jgi:hypothetical protein
MLLLGHLNAIGWVAHFFLLAELLFVYFASCLYALQLLSVLACPFLLKQFFFSSIPCYKFFKYFVLSGRIMVARLFASLLMLVRFVNSRKNY